jgi:Cft2 family RNA processing exonuclease
MKAGFLYLTKRDLEEMTPKQVDLLIMELNKKNKVKREKPPTKEEFKEKVKKLVEEGKLDKKFLKEG